MLLLTRICGTTFVGLCLIAAGCDRKPSKPTSATPTTATLPADLFAATAPADAMSVGQVKSDTGVTGEVVIRGRIGGRREPFVDGAAVFLLADSSMKSCRDLHGDQCKTPWDYCCEPRDSLAAKTATVQVVGTDGKPLRVGLQGKLQPLAVVTVTGNIASREAGTLVINATRIHVARGS